VSEPLARGRRRIDRVLAPGYLDGLEALPLEQVRALRQDAEQEEADLSYLRRLLQGRIDILRAELDRRSGSSAGPRVVDQLAEILADQPSLRPALGRHLSVEPSRVGEYRRSMERMIADVDLSDVTARSEAEIRSAMESLTGCEHSVSQKRRAVQRIADACRQEVARRYRTGEAQVADLLAGQAENR
jgi:hypothetical protein